MKKIPFAKYNKEYGIYHLSDYLIILTKNKKFIIGFYDKNLNKFFEQLDNFKMKPIKKSNILGWNYLNCKKIMNGLKYVMC